MTDELGRIRKKLALAESRYYLRICLGVMKKTKILSQHNRCPNEIPTEHLLNTRLESYSCTIFFGEDGSYRNRL
jgi:hypothetical protein